MLEREGGGRRKGKEGGEGGRGKEGGLKHTHTHTPSSLTCIVTLHCRERSIIVIPAPVHVDPVSVGADGVTIATTGHLGTLERLHIVVFIFGRGLHAGPGAGSWRKRRHCTYMDVLTWYMAHIRSK